MDEAWVIAPWVSPVITGTSTTSSKSGSGVGQLVELRPPMEISDGTIIPSCSRPNWEREIHVEGTVGIRSPSPGLCGNATMD